VNPTRAELPETVKDNVTFIDQHTRTTAALQELFQLLEDYSPVWYTEEHHDRVAGVLRGWFPAKSRC
jgi:prephenate dehydrogenase